MTGTVDHFPASEFAILGFLFPGPSHGYELHKKMTDPSGIGMVWEVKLSNLYAQLGKLEKKGLILKKPQIQESRPSRTKYALTPAGMATFTEWLHTNISHPRHFRQEFMVRLYFLQTYEPENVQNQIHTQLSECDSWLSWIRRKGSDAFSYENALYQFRKSQVQSMIEWLNWLLDQIKNSI